MTDKTIEIKDGDSYIFIKFESLGSAMFAMDMNALPTQIAGATAFLNKQADIGFMAQISDNLSKRESKQIAKPENTIMVGRK